ncbi:family 16 glycoside hydrolase [Lacibacter sp.]|uniref:family 16 glycoside hydrolase n=1 Tax=Lacibacter sp. TaxID=1915409 RepID=UPI002B4B4BFB|nr:family 16 glycoside hydrolase [Lacibacter sp.]HLP38464.1 family 16 glycoside hydrolase [Lacibacter sp.]
MNTTKLFTTLFSVLGISFSLIAQKPEKFQNLKFEKQTFELHNVTGEIIKFQGEQVLKIERDLNALPFDSTNIEATVDEPHYARLIGLDDFENGTIEVKMYSQLQNPAPYSGVAGFIGVYFRVKEDDSAFEGIYVRPKVGRATNQQHRNHAVQYISYPHYKFDTLRKIAPYKYEGSAPVALNEWITMRIEVNGETAEMFINDMKYSSFIVDKMLGNHKKGGIGLYVDIGTIGYFKDLKVTKRALKVKTKAIEKINGI